MLPVELLLAIADLLPHDALAALALASSRLSHIAQRVLYRHLSLSAPSRVLLLLARKPHIARHVRSFYLALDAVSPVFARFYVVLATALHNMSELHSLHLLVDSAASWVLRDASYPNLVHLTSTFALDDNVARLLQKTPSLLELEVDSIPTMSARSSPIPVTAIPRLEQFIGSARAAALIVPGRPVRSIHLSGSLAEDDVPLLARSTAPVLVLGAVTNSSPVSFLQLLHRHLPHLAYLRVMSTQNLFQPPAPEFYEQVANVLASFADLNAFELSGMHWGSQPKRDDESKRVWQSSPLSNGTHPSDQLLFGTDFFLAY
ncbi:hypothetical protein OG21DRAFT_1480908 [Imleria badia]|nr:hypothetical protein OG21DRAFT_1480908 [Imleria badia]